MLCYAILDWIGLLSFYAFLLLPMAVRHLNLLLLLHICSLTISRTAQNLPLLTLLLLEFPYIFSFPLYFSFTQR